MACENGINPAISQELVSVLGEDTANLLIEYLKRENAIMEGGIIDVKRLELVLETLFGNASLVMMQKLLLVQNKSISIGLR